MLGRLSARFASARARSQGTAPLVGLVIGVGVIVPLGVTHFIGSSSQTWIGERITAIHSKDQNELTAVITKQHALIGSPINKVLECYPKFTDQDWDDLESLVGREGGERQMVQGFRNIRELRSRYGAPAKEMNWNALDWAIIHGNKDAILCLLSNSEHLISDDSGYQFKKERQTWHRLVSHPACQQLIEPLMNDISKGYLTSKIRDRIIAAVCLNGQVQGDLDYYSKLPHNNVNVLKHIVADEANLPVIIRASSFLHSISREKKGIDNLQQHHEAVIESLIRQSRLDILQTLSGVHSPSPLLYCATAPPSCLLLCI